jgi:hypothetical protein
MRSYTNLIEDYSAPPSTYKLYAKGEHCTNAEPGDLILIKHKGLMPAIIRFGQRIYYWRKRFMGHAEYKKEYCNFNHAAVVVEGGKDAAIVEMEARGGHKTNLSNYQAEEYAIIKIQASVSQKQAAVNFANYCLGIEYGYLAIFAISMNIIFGMSILLISRSLICSAATSLSARCMGLIPDGPDVTVMPADHARYFGVQFQ